MGVFSLRRVVDYLRYIYTVQAKNYLWNLMRLFAVPLFFAVLSRDVGTASDMAMFVYIVAAWVFPVREKSLLRGRGTKVMAMTLPVSTEERLVAMMFNLMVVLPVASLLTSVLAVVAATPFHYHSMSTPAIMEFLGSHVGRYYLEWSIYVLVQLFAAVSLFMAIISRRSIMMTYAVAIVGIILFLYAVVGFAVDHEWYINIELHIDTVEIVGKIFYCLLPVVFYVLSYVALKRRQVKW